MPDNIILVDQNDNQTGTSEKLKAHKEGLLHRAFSIMIFDEAGNILLQQRAAEKYHSAGLWTNACCSHPKPGENLKDAALARLQKEMGFQTNIEKAFVIIYKIELDNGITEHEFDHVFTGTWNGIPSPDPTEVSDWKWISRKDLDSDMKQNPDHYTYWFRLIMEKLESK